jgi:hypothetical protein
MRSGISVRCIISAAIALALALGVAPTASADDAFKKKVDDYAEYRGQKKCRDKPREGTLGVVQILRDTFPEHARFSLMRACDLGPRSEHKDGRAIDWMVRVNREDEREAAEDFIEYLTAKDVDGKKNAHLRRLGVMYIIWNKEILRSYEIKKGWQPYEGPNDHTTHMHISLSPDGAEKRTSFWQR